MTYPRPWRKGTVVARNARVLGGGRCLVHRIVYDDGDGEIADLDVIDFVTLSGGPL